MIIKYTKMFPSKTLQNLPKIGIFCLKTNHLATLLCFRYFCARLSQENANAPTLYSEVLTKMSTLKILLSKKTAFIITCVK
jgi:hypothetical protein